MFSSARETVRLRSLGRRVPLTALSQLQPVFLLQMLIGLSQVLNGSAACPDAIGRALVLDGQQRLRRLREAAPHVELPLDHLLDRLRPNRPSLGQLSDEEDAVRALLEMCLGLVLRCLSRTGHRAGRHGPSEILKPVARLDAQVPSDSSSLHPLFRARSCLIS